MPATLPAYMSRLGLQPEPLQGPAQPLPDASLRRPELRVDIQPLTHLSTMHPSAVTTTPASALPDSPRVSMPSPASSTSSNSPRMTDVHASAVVPIARAHGAEERHQELYPPPALPRLIPEAHFRFPSQPVLADTTDATAAGLGSIPSEAKKPPAVRAASKLTKSSSLPSCSSSPSSTAQASSRAPLAHPYARIYARKAADPSAKRRKMWNHALEKSLFTPEEIATLGAPNRRAIYIASLEKHVDELHAQLIELGLYPVPFEALEPYTGLNSKTAKVRLDAFFPPVRMLTIDCRAW